ncbi:hypothetical protein Fmac_006874 [Flemingia macrophylla]|uniref:Uncharacterized protein n=1 Tax=Flemingia macrophylla TaxID=520843 RepID=A0ABD1NBW5_9FABA
MELKQMQTRFNSICHRVHLIDTLQDESTASQKHPSPRSSKINKPGQERKHPKSRLSNSRVYVNS